MANTARKRYPNEFRIKVAQAAEKSPIPEVAKKFKVPENNIYNWRATLRQHGEAGFVGMGKRGPRAKAKAAPSVSSVQLKKQIERATEKALSGVLESLQSQLSTERRLRREAERKLSQLRSKLQRLVKTAKG